MDHGGHGGWKGIKLDDKGIMANNGGWQGCVGK